MSSLVGFRAPILTIEEQGTDFETAISFRLEGAIHGGIPPDSEDEWIPPFWRGTPDILFYERIDLVDIEDAADAIKVEVVEHVRQAREAKKSSPKRKYEGVETEAGHGSHGQVDDQVHQQVPPKAKKRSPKQRYKEVETEAGPSKPRSSARKRTSR